MVVCNRERGRRGRADEEENWWQGRFDRRRDSHVAHPVCRKTPNIETVWTEICRKRKKGFEGTFTSSTSNGSSVKGWLDEGWKGVSMERLGSSRCSCEPEGNFWAAISLQSFGGSPPQESILKEGQQESWRQEKIGIFVVGRCRSPR